MHADFWLMDANIFITHINENHREIIIKRRKNVEHVPPAGRGEAPRP
jgi:hypothetical protein